MNHNDLAEEMGSLVRLASPDRSRLVAKRRSQQLRKWNEYDKNQDKESLRRKREMKVDMMRNMRSVHFSPNVMLLQATCHDDFNEGRSGIVLSFVLLLISCLGADFDFSQ